MRATDLDQCTLLAAFEAARDVGAALSLAQLRRSLPAVMNRLIPSDRVNVDELVLDAALVVVAPTPVPSYWPLYGEVWRQHVWEHPLWRFPRRQRLTRATAFQDFSQDGRWASLLSRNYPAKWR